MTNQLPHSQLIRRADQFEMLINNLLEISSEVFVVPNGYDLMVEVLPNIIKDDNQQLQDDTNTVKNIFRVMDFEIFDAPSGLHHNCFLAIEKENLNE